MSIYVTICCDGPGCLAHVDTSSDGDAADRARREGWDLGDAGTFDFCPQHQIEMAS